MLDSASVILVPANSRLQDLAQVTAPLGPGLSHLPSGQHPSTHLVSAQLREAGADPRLRSWCGCPHPGLERQGPEEEGSEHVWRTAESPGRAEGKCQEVGRGSRDDSSPFSTLTFQEVGLQRRRHRHPRSHPPHLPPGLSRMGPPQRRWSIRKGGASPCVGNLATARVLGCSTALTPRIQTSPTFSFQNVSTPERGRGHGRNRH